LSLSPANQCLLQLGAVDQGHLPEIPETHPKTVVTYVYLPVGEKAFKPIPDLKSLPYDIATTTISTGKKVRFIVRVETGTIDRGIYQNAILHDPKSDAPVSPFAPPAGWNRKLIAIHGSGCTGGWYVRGGTEGAKPIDRSQLAKGYALFTNTLNHPTNSCNVLVAAEATTLGKEHFIKTFGVPDWTMSTGGSGGAYTTLQIADAFPGRCDSPGVPERSLAERRRRPIRHPHLRQRYLERSSFVPLRLVSFRIA
jgi:hypothetical protein